MTGIFAAENKTVAAFIFSLGIFVCLIAGYGRRTKVKIVFIFALIYTAGYFYSDYMSVSSRWYETENLDGKYAMATGKVYDISEDEDKSRIYIEKATVITEDSKYLNTNLIIYFSDDIQVNMGQVISAEGEVSYFDTAANPGNFDARDYYRRKGVDFMMFADKGEIVNYKINYIDESLYYVRKSLENTYLSALPKDKAGVLLAMTSGDKSLLTDDIKNLYRNGGIAHILAISGLHISMIGTVLLKILKKAGISYGRAAVISGVAVIMFGMLCGFGISALRAIIMFIIMVASGVLGRAYDSLTALGIAAVVILIINPMNMLSASFLLSFSAVYGAVYVDKVLNSFLRTENFIAKSMILSFSIQLTILPVLMFFYYEIPLYSCLINVVVLPFAGVLLAGALIGGILGFIFMPVAGMVLGVCSLILEGYSIVCKAFEYLPFNTIITGRPSPVIIGAYYVFLIGMMVFLENYNKEKYNMTLRILAMTLVSMVWTYALSFKNFGNTEVVMLDVGQGDGIFASADGLKLFFDGGSSDENSVGKYRILPYLKYRGVSHIDYWFVSHTDNDHISGLAEVLESGYRVDCLVFAKGMPEDDKSEYLRKLAEKNKTRVVALGRGEAIMYKNTYLKCIYPYENGDNSDKNEASMVIELISGDFKALFTGDAGERAEKEMIESGVLEDIMLLKCAHHGSKYSSTEEFLDIVRPEAVIISAGEDNSYDHPNDEALCRLYNVCKNVYCTIDDGPVRIVFKNGKMLICD